MLFSTAHAKHLFSYLNNQTCFPKYIFHLTKLLSNSYLQWYEHYLQKWNWKYNLLFYTHTRATETMTKIYRSFHWYINIPSNCMFNLEYSESNFSYLHFKVHTQCDLTKFHVNITMEHFNTSSLTNVCLTTIILNEK